MSDPEFIDPSDIEPGPIRHESLPPNSSNRSSRSSS